MNTHEVARFYHSLGFNVIPWMHKSKTTPLIPGWKQYQSFHQTSEIVDGLFRGKECGIAILTGEISGVTVFDDDNEQGIQRIKSGVISRTGGGGFHHFFKYDKRFETSVNVDLKMDIRNDGTLAFVYPTIHESGKMYEFVGGIERLRNLPEVPTDDPLINSLLSATPKQDRKQEDAKVAKEGYGKYFNIEGIGSRDSTLKDFCRMLWMRGHTRAETLSLATYANNTYKPPLSKEDVAEKVRSTFDGLGERQDTTIGLVRRTLPTEEAPEMIFESAYEASERFQREDREYAELPEIGVPILSEYFKFRKNSLIVLAGDTGMGKTPFCSHFAAKYALTGKKVLFAPIETGSGYVSKIMRDDIGNELIDNVKFLTFADGMGNIDTFYKGVEKQFETEHYDLVILDHIHFINAMPDEQSEDETISHISETLRKIAAKFDTCVFASAQVNKPDTSRYPNKHDIRFGRKLIQDASIVMVIHKKAIKMDREFGSSDSVYESNGVLILDKNRMTHVTRMIPFDVREKKLVLDWKIKSVSQDLKNVLDTVI